MAGAAITQPASSETDPFSTTGPLGLRVVSVLEPSVAKFEAWFVHGLTGNREKTWTHENGVFWPSLLANDFPSARVITYGYDANVLSFENKWQNAETSGLHSYGEGLAKAIRNSRQGDGAPPKDLPIYFIAHSLGGLVVEQALLICLGAAEPSLNDIATKAAAGILFMGTPHRGSHLATWGSVLRKVVMQRLRTTNEQIFQALTEGSDVGKDLEDKFQAEVQNENGRLKHLKLHCFYETKVMTGLKREVVPKNSATLAGVGKTPISGTHTSMVHFESNRDSEYQKVKGELESWLNPIEDEEEEEEDDDTGFGGMRGATIGNVRGNVDARVQRAKRDINNGPAVTGDHGQMNFNRGRRAKKNTKKPARSAVKDESSDDDDSSDWSV